MFVPVAKVNEIPDPGKMTLEVDDRLIVVFHVGGSFFCLEDVCTHDGGPLGDGDLDEHAIACPRHGAKFDIRDGSAMTMPATEATLVHQVQIDGDDICVELSDED